MSAARNHGRVFAALVATLLVGVPAIGTAVSPASADAIAVASRIDIDNFGRINDHYFRGAQPAGDDYADLARLGVRMVIDLQADGSADEGKLVEAAGMKFRRIGLTTRVAPTSQALTEFLSLVNDPANQPVYVHCAGGRHRTGVMTAVYRMTYDGWNPDRAFKEMKQYKFGADFLHPEFKRFVYAYRVEPRQTASPVLAVAAPVATP
jgi:tyrosine-protein phosphatase SIW14